MKILFGILNLFVLCAMISIGAYHYKDLYAQEYVNSMPSDELFCLQQNIFFETRNQATLGQEAAAWVTLHRVDSKTYPSTICGVVWQDYAFSWTHDGKADYPDDNTLEQRAWESSEHTAKIVLMSWIKNERSPVENAVMYHADYVEPYWASSYDRVVSIDDHIFYK